MKKTHLVEGNGNGGGGVTRTTVFLPNVLNENLTCLALQNDVPKAEIVRQALAEYMQKKGIKPDKKPKITITY